MNTREMDVREVDRSSLADLSSIRVRRNAENQLDLEDLKRQTPNLYCYRVGKMVVAFDYLNNGKTINDAFALMVQAGM